MEWISRSAGRAHFQIETPASIRGLKLVPLLAHTVLPFEGALVVPKLGISASGINEQ
jgi:hypothetical protein